MKMWSAFCKFPPGNYAEMIARHAPGIDGFLAMAPKKRFDALMDSLCGRCRPNILPQNVDVLRIYNQLADQYRYTISPRRDNGRTIFVSRPIAIPNIEIEAAVRRAHVSDPDTVFAKIRFLIGEILSGLK